MVKSNRVTQLDRQLAMLAGAVVAGLLFRDVPFDLLMGDAGEFHFAAWNWGLAHPTGYPLYMLVGGAWQHLWAPFGLAPAASLNLLSALFAGVATALLFLLVAGWAPGPPPVRRLAAGLAAAFFAANPTFRSQSFQAEVYTLQAVLLLATFLAAQRLASPAEAASMDAARRWQARSIALIAFVWALALTHHATSALLALPLLAYLFLITPTWWRHGITWLWSVPAGLAPLLLYLYVPLRSGPGASPWYHQRLGDGVLTLYDGSWQAFWRFITGQSISVGFHDLGGTLDNVPAALVLWLRHFEWTGLVLIVTGLAVLVRTRNWPVLVLTLGYALLQQLFNLFYAIGDIFVYYIPVYLMACVWIGLAAGGIGTAFRSQPDQPPPERATAAPPAASQTWSILLIVALYVLPFQLWARYNALFEPLQAESAAARAKWEEILAAGAPADAILVSNDRNEIVPLFYFQFVEGRGRGHTGLFPLIAPDDRFADIGTTVQTALDEGGDQPVYLVKSMPGLEVRFRVEPRTPPLEEVMGPAVAATPQHTVALAYGPLQLVGYDWKKAAGGVEITLFWQVTETPATDYTTTVQLFNAEGEKVGQDDRRPGGDYYPSSLWKPGEMLLDRHVVPLAPGSEPVTMLAGMYSGPGAALLAPALEIATPN
ncbi:MAG: DUF2723 domain-containing protein [Caldilineaceae bacterium]|nr:DUF2723 domain-containing protein [Caldilineaceae bacterium]